MPLTAGQLRILILLLSEDFPGAVELRKQVLWAESVEYGSARFYLRVSSSAPKAAVETRTPVEAHYDPEKARNILGVAAWDAGSGFSSEYWLHVENGYLHQVEHVAALLEGADNTQDLDLLGYEVLVRRWYPLREGEA